MIIKILIVILLIGGISAISSDYSLSFKSDSTLTKIYTSEFCSFSKNCNKNTPTEINVNFDKDSNGVIEINFKSVRRSKELN